MTKRAFSFEVLDGLPATGDLPVQFSATGMGTHSQGFVVRFHSQVTDGSWVGNFQRGLSHFDQAIAHPNGTDVIVVAGGEVYVVDPESRALKENFGGTFTTILAVTERNLYIFGTTIDFEALGPEGRLWRSKRIALDGLRSVAVDGETLSGEAWCIESEWRPFSLDIRSGKHTGGADIWW